MLSMTALSRRLTPAVPCPSTWTVGSIPALAMNPPAAAADIRPSSVVARAIAVTASSAWAAWADVSAETNLGAGGTGPAATAAWPSTGVAPACAGGGIRCGSTIACGCGAAAGAGGGEGMSGAGPAGIAGAPASGTGAAAWRSATAERAASISLRISSCISGVEAIVLVGPPCDDCTVCDCCRWSPGRSELNGTTTTWRTTLSPPPRCPLMSGSLTTGIMLSDPAGTKRDFTGSNRSLSTCTP